MKRLLTIIWFILILTGCGAQTPEQPELPEVRTDVPTTGEEEMLIVDVVGEVKRPGIVRVKPGARVFEVLEAAGGMTEHAVTDSLNMARKVRDGEQIRLLNAKQAAEADSTDRRIDLNRASEAELQTIRGIGPAKAQDIVRYRKEHGPFASVEDLKKIRGIKDAFFERVKEDLKVE